MTYTSSWNPNRSQPTVCELCSNIVDHDELVESEVTGLNGLWVCRDCQRAGATTLTYEDLVARNGRFDVPVEDIELREPIGGPRWWDDPYNDPHRIIADAGVILATDGGLVIRRD